MKQLTPELQIEILQEATKNIKLDNDKFLCIILRDILWNRDIVPQDHDPNISDYIPLFTRQNADFFNTNPKLRHAWWLVCLEEDRLRFLNWLIEENKKLL